MKQKTLFKIALICALIGIFLLYLISNNADLDNTSIFNAKHFEEGVVKVKGTVKEIEPIGGIQIIRISATETIPAVVFEDTEIDTIQVGDTIEIIGEIDSYEGRKQLIVNEIIK